MTAAGGGFAAAAFPKGVIASERRLSCGLSAALAGGGASLSFGILFEDFATGAALSFGPADEDRGDFKGKALFFARLALDIGFNLAMPSFAGEVRSTVASRSEVDCYKACLLVHSGSSCALKDGCALLTLCWAQREFYRHMLMIPSQWYCRLLLWRAIPALYYLLERATGLGLAKHKCKLLSLAYSSDFRSWYEGAF